MPRDKADKIMQYLNWGLGHTSDPILGALLNQQSRLGYVHQGLNKLLREGVLLSNYHYSHTRQQPLGI